MNRFGRIFSMQIFGESHGISCGILIDGCPPGIPLTTDDLLIDLDKRKSGRIGTTTRLETDIPIIKSGVFNSFTTGAPILIEFLNNDKNSDDYHRIKDTPRPGHADFTAYTKYSGFNDYRGGGHFSGRLTIGLVAAGVIAKKILKNLEFNTILESAGGKNDIEEAINEAVAFGDSIGGIVSCRISNLPVGIGEPFFNSVESYISSIVFSVPAVKGIEFGLGFGAASMKGSEHNDEIINKEGITKTNNAGGINGGISNGNELNFKVAIKPASSIKKQQKTINLKTGKQTDLSIGGRHDACIALRAVVVIESVAAIALADLLLIHNSKKS